MPLSSTVGVKPAENRNRRPQQRAPHPTFGVLIPPKFGVTATENSPSLRDRLPTEPSLYDWLLTTDTSYCILNDYMRPGVWFAGKLNSQFYIQHSSLDLTIIQDKILPGADFVRRF
jgi:hypothetical protein